MSLSRQADGYLLAITLGESFGTLKAFQLESPSRMVLDLFRSRVPTDVEVPPDTPAPGFPGQDATADRSPDIPVPPRPTPRPAPGPTDDVAQGILKTITLDPGHGGSETGATGRSGLQEKDVTLAIVRRLAQLLESRLGVRVLVTRDGDNYLELDERTTIANNNKSDLFLSIHANASPGRNASGSEVYYLSYEASDDEAGRVAASENVSGSARPRATSDLDFILWDMAQASHLNESARLAELLQDELQAGRSENRNRGIKQAPFRVLMGATMPAALIEVGFITNPEEERRLGSSDYQDQLANAIYRGLVKYKDRFDRQASLGRQRSGERD
jgi:N-acetylmuramoyl-L-alanine amidase